MCDGSDLCYAENTVIKGYLDLTSTRDLLGVETPNNFSSCSSSVGANFATHMDKWAVPTQYYVANLLDRGIRMLVYAGTNDWQCNWVANKLWVDKLEWHGQIEYLSTTWRKWKVNGGVVGEVRDTALLTFASIRGAGHMMSPF
jgi:carboxypeptidase C (cathepsin A)